MEYLEAIAIKRLRPENLPGHLAHLLDEADRVIRLKQAMCAASDTELVKLQLPVLSAEQRARANAVLLHNLALHCGRLEAWGGPRRQRAIKPIELKKDPIERDVPLPATVGDGHGIRSLSV